MIGPELPPSSNDDKNTWRRKLHTVIFGADTPLGKAFDVCLLILIVISVLAIMLETVDSVRLGYKVQLRIAEWVFTILFTIEYVLRLIAVRRPLRYARSFFGIVDLLSILPSFISLFLPATHYYFVTIRVLRLLRLFRIFKMVRYIGGANLILMALKSSRPKITVFLFAVVTMAIVMGSLMYVVEGPSNPKFSSIPTSAYWAIVTITTVGYGDISPQHPFGQFIAAVGMLMGYAIIAVPTGIVGAEISRQMASKLDYSNKACHHCGTQVHTTDALYCRICGQELG